jgi:hypothetical protein
MSKRPDKQPVGAPLGSQNGLPHGIVAFKNEIKRRTRRGRSLIERRSTAGRNAVAMREELISDTGGADNLSVVKVGIDRDDRARHLLPGGMRPQNIPGDPQG